MFVRSCMIWLAFGLLVHGCGTHADLGDIHTGTQRQAKLGCYRAVGSVLQQRNPRW
jgi:hypothetical protein